MKDKLLIKKYENRRLYDTERSTYVTLDDISRLIKQGQAIEVVDVKTKEDVTAFILTQIILDQSKKKNSLLPVALLHLIIQYGDNLLNDFFENYLQQTLRNYLSYRALADDQFKKWLDVSMDLSATTKKTMNEIAPFKRFFDLFPSESSAQSEKER